MIKVFKTSVHHQNDAKAIVASLLTRYPGYRINFDLQDCDRILRIEGSPFAATEITVFLKCLGYLCVELH
ncbi:MULTISPECIES: hypothetical protein [unclassified Flavobacterium]|uniref:hypothetical protein n=1 Tax=unclassified Flavobacterium TaxID=196869 RepID=UPI000965BD20|nr:MULTISPECIES: hypothetical protein [unclassified Flavobacterium]MBN9284490.1 hypothetical protein [Flavobacterium sp.]OJV72786.1 MAG: hypothetical protein BGO42_15280 [Flavobacterium sp. 40-81]